MVNQVISGYPTHGKRHPSLCESDHRNEDFTYLYICKNLVWGIILQGYSLWNVVPNLNTSISASESTRCLNLPIQLS